MKTYKHLTEKEFRMIKGITEMGLHLNQLTSITGRSVATIERIKHASSLADYQTNVRYGKKTKTPSLTNGVSGIKRTDSHPQSTIALLERIAIAVEKLVAQGTHE